MNIIQNICFLIEEVSNEMNLQILHVETNDTDLRIDFGVCHLYCVMRNGEYINIATYSDKHGAIYSFAPRHIHYSKISEKDVKMPLTAILKEQHGN